jgi:hypothetical protein
MRKLLSGVLAIALLAGAPAALAQEAVLPQGEVLAMADLAQVEGAIGLIGFPNWIPGWGLIGSVNLIDIGLISVPIVDFGILNGLLSLVGAFF